MPSKRRWILHVEGRWFLSTVRNQEGSSGLLHPSYRPREQRFGSVDDPHFRDYPVRKSSKFLRSQILTKDVSNDL
jgi:hypothetical protein